MRGGAPVDRPCAASEGEEPTMSLARTPTDGGASPRQLLVLAIPAILLGAFAALLLWALEQVADLLSGVLWDTLPDALGVDPNGWWIVLILTLTGPRGRHRAPLPPRPRRARLGDDRADLAAAASCACCPASRVVTVLSLAGGVSLGPENPIIAINVGITVALFARFLPQRSRADRGADRGGRNRRRAVRHPRRRGAALHRDRRRGEGRRVAVGPAVPPGRRGRRRRDHDAPARRAADGVRPARRTGARRRSTC